MQDLERDLTLVLEILGEEDCGHPSAAQLPLEGIPGQSRLEAAEEIAQSRCLWRRVSKASPGWDFRRWVTAVAETVGIDRRVLLSAAERGLPLGLCNVLSPNRGGCVIPRFKEQRSSNSFQDLRRAGYRLFTLTAPC